MNPLTDRREIVTLPDGKTIEVIRPGREATRNYRLTREAFERYQQHFVQALSAWPRETQWLIPPGVSPNTYVCQLREARRALLMFGYNPEMQRQMQAIDHEVAITLDPRGDSVWFRHRDGQGRKKDYAPMIKSTRTMTHDASSVRPMPPPDQLEALCKLLGAKLINGPVLLRGRIPPPLLADLELSFDVAFAYDEQTDITTVL